MACENHLTALENQIPSRASPLPLRSVTARSATHPVTYITVWLRLSSPGSLPGLSSASNGLAQCATAREVSSGWVCGRPGRGRAAAAQSEMKSGKVTNATDYVPYDAQIKRRIYNPPYNRLRAKQSVRNLNSCPISRVRSDRRRQQGPSPPPSGRPPEEFCFPPLRTQQITRDELFDNSERRDECCPSITQNGRHSARGERPDFKTQLPSAVGDSFIHSYSR